jgi:hypothetical protein
MTLIHYAVFFLYLLGKGNEMDYDGTNLTFPFLFVNIIVGGVPVFGAYYLVSKIWRKIGN